MEAAQRGLNSGLCYFHIDEPAFGTVLYFPNLTALNSYFRATGTVDSFDVLVEARNDDGLGQTDVGGIYAYVMLQAHELSGEERYLDEARNAIDAARGMRFELNYQANLTAWGAAACLRLCRITNDEFYLRQSYVYPASFFHNCQIWESEIKNAHHYRRFLGVTCLHDAPYMAMYEAFDSFAAFERYLKDSGPDLDSAVQKLIIEYCRYALNLRGIISQMRCRRRSLQLKSATGALIESCRFRWKICIRTARSGRRLTAPALRLFSPAGASTTSKAHPFGCSAIIFR